MRTQWQKEEHQGRLTPAESKLAIRMRVSPKRYFSTLDICKILGCVSARDHVRKMKVAGCPIGPAKLLRTNENGSRIYGWRIAQ